MFIIQDGECTAIRKRPEKGLLAGLYELPNTQGHLKSEDALLYVKELGLDPLYIEELPPAKHIFSHIEWRMQAYRIKVSSVNNTQFHLLLERMQSISRRKQQDETVKYCDSML